MSVEPNWTGYGDPRYAIVQRPIAPGLDLRDMLRQHILVRALAHMRAAEERRQQALAGGDVQGYRASIRRAVRSLYGALPAGEQRPAPAVTLVSAFDKPGHRLESVLFDSYPGWQVNATVFVPTDYAPPFPAVIVPVGHSGKQFANYQLPAQLMARCGYLAVLFDPPGQSGEKQPGNDHFADGVRCYLVGETSSQYFVADALRCIDYVQSRPDVDASRGVAMTGVSGGGTTTVLASLLDERVRLVAPSCCLSPLSALDISQCYASCPETLMAGRYALELDEVDLLCAVAAPTLLMAGETDEVFHLETTAALAEQVAAFHRLEGTPERFEFYVDYGRGHCYSLDQARRFVAFANCWLLGQPERALPDLPDEALAMTPYEELRCYPSPDVNMRSLTLERARSLQQGRSERRADAQAERRYVREALSALCGVTGPVMAPPAESGTALQVWTHDWRQVLLRPEPGIALPTSVLAYRSRAAATLLHFDDQGRNRLLYRDGPLARAAGFLREGVGCHVISVDLRGWGDSYPGMYPYELAGWGSIERALAYRSNALGDPLLAMRVRDAMAALAYACAEEPARSAPLLLTGAGLGGLVALHVAMLAREELGTSPEGDGLAGVVIWDGLASWLALLEAERYTWTEDAFAAGVLPHYDLPDLVRLALVPVRVLNPRDGRGEVLQTEALAQLNADAGADVYSLAEGEGLAVAIAHAVQALLGSPPGPLAATH